LVLAGILLALGLRGCSGALTTKAPAHTIPVPKAERPQGDPDALIREAEKGHLARVQQLIRAGTSPNAKDREGETALMKAAAGGHIEVVTALVEAPGVEVNEIDAKGETALMKAAENGQTAVVELLLGPGSQGRPAPNLKDDQGQTALMKAKAKNHTAVVEILRKAGAKE
jgi:ankyrin repeat protein